MELGRRLNFAHNNQQQIYNIMYGKCQFPVKHIPNLCNVIKVRQDEIISMMALDYAEALIKAIEDNQSKPKETIE
jgi:hypothetical protein